MSIKCDCCGREMDDRWKIEGMPGIGGNCGECGDDLCAECGSWNEEGLCRYCAMSVEELEFLLPLDFQRREKKEMPCSNCERIDYVTITYEQEMWRSDSYGLNGKKTRQYQISYRNKKAFSQLRGKSYFQTDRHRTLREVLIDAHKMLDRLQHKYQKSQ